MFEFLFASQNMPFIVALGLMLGIGLLEGLATLLGMGVSGMLDSLMPDVDLDALGSAADGLAGADADGIHLVDAHHSFLGILSKLLGWLHIGRVPILMLLVIFLFAFGSLGLIIQSMAVNIFGNLLPVAMAAGGAFFGSLLVVRAAGGVLYRIMPRDESEAVSEQSFIGRVAHVTIGSARQGMPAQARLRDQHGRTHYVMVEPDDPAQSFPAGCDVLIVKRSNAVFYVIAATSELVD